MFSFFNIFTDIDISVLARLIRNQGRSRFSYPPAFRMHHQALKMKDGWRIKAIPKCQASAMATSVAKTERLRR